MHSFDGHGCTFHYNSDFSGEIVIHNIKDDKEIFVDGEDLLKFVAYCYIQGKRIEEIEQMTYKDLLKR